MAITQAMCTSFKIELLDGVHDFMTVAHGGDQFKIALYTSSATLSAATTAYTTSGEVSSSGTNYAAGGEDLTVSVEPTNGGSGTTAYLSFDTIAWPNASITARGAMIYNSSKSNKAVCILDFGSDKTSTDGDFTINFPAANSSSAIIRIA